MTLFLLTLAVLVLGALFVFRASLRRVPDRHIGIVYRRYGRRHPQESTRVSIYGSVGPQARVLPPNTRQWVTPYVFEVKYVPQTHVPDGTIGLVEAKDGKVRPAGRRMGQYIECDYFQDGVAFISGGGEQGRQLGYLPGGAWYTINTELFKVITVNTIGRDPQPDLTAADLHEVAILEGNVGVVIVLDGKPPSQDPDVTGRIVDEHYSFRLPWVFLGRGGQRGVQEETLDGGHYAINPWFARVMHIPIRDLILNWSNKSPKDMDNYDAALDQIVVNIQGHRLSLEMSQVLRIPATSAARLVRRFGEGELTFTGSVHSAMAKPLPVRRFVERVLGAAVAGYFTEIVAKYGVLEFIREYDKVRLELEERMTQALDDWNVKACGTILGEFESDDQELNRLRRELAEQDLQLTKEERRYRILEKERANTDLEAEIKRIAIELKGEDENVVLRKQIEVLGQNGWLMEKLIASMRHMQVPGVVVGGGDLADQLLRLMPFTNAQDMLKTLISNTKMGQPPPAVAGDEKPPEIDKQ